MFYALLRRRKLLCCSAAWSPEGQHPRRCGHRSTRPRPATEKMTPPDSISLGHRTCSGTGTCCPRDTQTPPRRPQSTPGRSVLPVQRDRLLERGHGGGGGEEMLGLCAGMVPCLWSGEGGGRGRNRGEHILTRVDETGAWVGDNTFRESKSTVRGAKTNPKDLRCLPLLSSNASSGREGEGVRRRRDCHLAHHAKLCRTKPSSTPPPCRPHHTAAPVTSRRWTSSLHHCRTLSRPPTSPP